MVPCTWSNLLQALALGQRLPHAEVHDCISMRFVFDWRPLQIREIICARHQSKACDVREEVVQSGFEPGIPKMRVRPCSMHVVCLHKPTACMHT
jgi:hypothetical protein